MLRNNDEREKYIRDEKNWDILDYDIVTSECHDEESEKELHGGLITGIPKVRLLRLKGTSIYKIQVESALMHYKDKPHYATIQTMEFHSNGQMKSIYDLTINQLITYLRERKV